MLMKKILLVIFALISLNAFSQLQVKEGSFKHVPNAVMNDKYDHLDGNDLPMALIKISTENISEQERLRLKFQGNLATQITKTPKTGQMWIYISAENATFINFMHPDYGTCKYYLPEKLCDFCTYEMVLQYIPIAPVAANEPAKIQKTYFIVQSDQTDALVYIDGEMLGAKEARKLVDVGTTHTYKIECKLYHEESGSVTVNDKTVVNKQLRPAFGYLDISSTPEQGANVWVDGDLVGVTPIKTDKLASGTHTVRVMKDMYKMKEQSFTVADGQTTNATLNMAANFVNVTVNTDSQSDIYVDDEYKGKGRWIGRLSDGTHMFEARKTNHRTSKKSLDLVLGETKTISIDAPSPINGEIEINSTPMGATIYIDGKHYGETPNYISDILIGKHELKLTKQGCVSLTKTITIKEGETLSVNEKLQTGKEISISTDQSGDKIYVDGNYLGLSPISTCLSYGSHEVKAERNGKTVSKNIEVSQVEAHGRVSSTDKCELTFFGNQTITVKGVSFTMIAVEGGTFQMGATSEQGSDAESDESPVHNVTLSDYYIGETEVTQELWQAVMGKNPSYSKGNKKPVENVTWNECQEFIKKLNQLTGKSFRFPTEAEWEYAARGGNKSKGYKYSGSNTIDNVAWYTSNSGSKTHDVKTKQANELGIYDMSGNVYEWCQDWYGSYSNGAQTNPTGSSSGSSRVLRGGSWGSIAGRCRVSNRSSNYSGYLSNHLGLRLSHSQY